MTDKKTVKVKLVRSPIGTKESHRATVRGLGLRLRGAAQHRPERYQLALVLRECSDRCPDDAVQHPHRRAVELAHDEPRHVRVLAESLRLLEPVLSGRAVEDAAAILRNACSASRDPPASPHLRLKTARGQSRAHQQNQPA